MQPPPQLALPGPRSRALPLLVHHCRRHTPPALPAHACGAWRRMSCSTLPDTKADRQVLGTSQYAFVYQNHLHRGPKNSHVPHILLQQRTLWIECHKENWGSQQKLFRGGLLTRQSLLLQLTTGAPHHLLLGLARKRAPACRQSQQPISAHSTKVRH